MTYLLLKGDKFVLGDTKYAVVAQAGARLIGRQMFIGELKYATYGESFSDEELPRVFAKDAFNLLRNNFGWSAFRAVDWRD